MNPLIMTWIPSLWSYKTLWWLLTWKYSPPPERSTTRPVPRSPVSTCPGWAMAATQRWREMSTVTCTRRRVRFTCTPISLMRQHWGCYSTVCFHCEVYVRKCIVGKGEDYRGKVFTTRSGLTCQQWWSKFPHDHRWETSSASFTLCSLESSGAQGRPICIFQGWYQLLGKTNKQYLQSILICGKNETDWIQYTVYLCFVNKKTCYYCYNYYYYIWLILLAIIGWPLSGSSLSVFKSVQSCNTQASKCRAVSESQQQQSLSGQKGYL